jgi:hypothetical protein
MVKNIHSRWLLQHWIRAVNVLILAVVLDYLYLWLTVRYPAGPVLDILTALSFGFFLFAFTYWYLIEPLILLRAQLRDTSILKQKERRMFHNTR